MRRRLGAVVGEQQQDPPTGAVIGAAIEVHRVLGPGLLESVYQRALCKELKLRGIPAASQVKLPVCYKGEPLGGDDLVIDVVVDDRAVLELKAVDALHPIHEAQLLRTSGSAATVSGCNFNVLVLKDGIRRRVL
jgi:GxxExxY protein